MIKKLLLVISVISLSTLGGSASPKTIEAKQEYEVQIYPETEQYSREYEVYEVDYTPQE